MEKQMENTNPELKFNLTLNEANLVIKALSTQPLAEVIEVFNKIRNQATQQLETQPLSPQKDTAE